MHFSILNFRAFYLEHQAITSIKGERKCLKTMGKPLTQKKNLGFDHLWEILGAYKLQQIVIEPMKSTFFKLYIYVCIYILGNYIYIHKYIHAVKTCSLRIYLLTSLSCTSYCTYRILMAGLVQCLFYCLKNAAYPILPGLQPISDTSLFNRLMQVWGQNTTFTLLLFCMDMIWICFTYIKSQRFMELIDYYSYDFCNRKDDSFFFFSVQISLSLSIDINMCRV